MRYILKRYSYFVLFIMITMLFITGCAKVDYKSNDVKELEKRKKTPNITYSGQLVDIGIESNNGNDHSILSMAYSDEKYLLLLQETHDKPNYTLVSFSQDASDMQKISIPLDTEKLGMISHACFDRDGNIYVIISDLDTEISSNDALINIGIGKDTGSTNSSPVFLAGYNTDGEELFLKQILEDVDYDKYIQSIELGPDGKIYLFVSGKILRFDNENGIFENEVADYGYDYYGVLSKITDGNLVLIGWSGNGIVMDKLDTKTQTLINIDLPIDVDFYLDSVFPCIGYDFGFADDQAISAIMLDGGNTETILNFIDSGLDIRSVTGISFSDENHFAISGYDLNDNSVVYVLEKKEETTIEGIKELRIGCLWIDDHMRSAVVHFNQTNTEYRIKLEQYKYAEEEDEDFYLNMNKEIISGNMPDMLVINSGIPIHNYISKGLFEPLDKWFYEDGEIGNSEYMTNIFDAYRVDGNMYSIIPSFTVMGVIGKKELFGDITDCSIERLTNMMNERGLDFKSISPNMTRESMLYTMMYATGNEFLDWDNRRSNFDSKEFIQTLEFIKLFPKNINDDSIVDENEGRLLTGEALLKEAYICSFQDFIKSRGYVGGAYAIMGYPSMNGATPLICEDFQIVMNANSSSKEACWNFMRSFLLDEYQDSVESSLPVKMSSLEKLAKASQERPFDTNYEGEKEYYNYTVTIGDTVVDLDPLTQEDAQSCIKFLQSLNNHPSLDQSVIRIIVEEAGAFFADQKSSDEVANIINSKISTYMNESF